MKEALIVWTIFVTSVAVPLVLAPSVALRRELRLRRARDVAAIRLGVINGRRVCRILARAEVDPAYPIAHGRALKEYAGRQAERAYFEYLGRRYSR